MEEKKIIGGIDMWGNMMAIQAILDKKYIKQHDLNFDELLNERSLALIDELMEYGKETRCFHYWSLKEPSSDIVRAEEAADAIHFYLSLGIQFGANPADFVAAYDFFPVIMKDKKKKKAYCLRKAVSAAAVISESDNKSYNKGYLLMSFSFFWQAVQTDGFSEETMENAYYLKAQKNQQRDDHGL